MLAITDVLGHGQAILEICFALRWSDLGLAEKVRLLR